MASKSDAIVVGAGPNGLAAAIVLAKADCRVTVYEANDTIGGGARSAELTLPGFLHDVCSAVYPTGAVSPFFQSLPLRALGVEWLAPEVMLAHPFDDGTAAVVRHSIDETAAGLADDGHAWRRVVGGVANSWPRIQREVLGPMRLPAHPIAMTRFGLHAIQSAEGLARRVFRRAQARALFAGIAAHGMVPLDRTATAAFGLVLGGLAHVGGWVLPKGGAQRIPDALATHLRSLGGEIVTNVRVPSLATLPPADLTLCDLSPRPFVQVARDRLPPWFQRRLARFRYGPGAFKVDWALDGAIPWRAPECQLAGTVHLGGTLEEIVRSEASVAAGTPPESPFVLLVQPTVVDPSRAPANRHIAWGYCHVPSGCTVNMLDRIERQIERFAPGFRDRVLARATRSPADIERENANFVGGDIGSGISDLGQLFLRPTAMTYRTPVQGLYLCSASTPPGVSVHGLCGYYAATRALGDLERRT